MKITDIVLFKIYGEYELPPHFSDRGDRQTQQLDIYPETEFKNIESRNSDKNSDNIIEDIYLKILTDKDISGIYGPININQAFIIKENLTKPLLGCNPLAIEKLFDQMMRLNRHGRSGLFMTAISSVDLALWDLKSKKMEIPLYLLLGGAVRNEIPAYASMLGFSIEPSRAAQTALEYKEKGFKAQKWFFRYGPGDGTEGINKNIAMAEAVREAVGENYPLMFDAYMSWDVNYTIKMLKNLKKVQPTWVEEPIPPEKVEGFRKIKQETSLPLATGEHVYTRWQVQELLQAGVVNYIQTDPVWTGGISELVKICALASAFEVPVVAHGHSLLPALQVAASQSPAVVPYIEYLIKHQDRKQYFRKNIYKPQNGNIELPSAPGLGLELDQNKIKEKEILFK